MMICDLTLDLGSYIDDLGYWTEVGGESGRKIRSLKTLKNFEQTNDINIDSTYARDIIKG